MPLLGARSLANRSTRSTTKCIDAPLARRAVIWGHALRRSLALHKTKQPCVDVRAAHELRIGALAFFSRAGRAERAAHAIHAGVADGAVRIARAKGTRCDVRRTQAALADLADPACAGVYAARSTATTSTNRAAWASAVGIALRPWQAAARDTFRASLARFISAADRSARVVHAASPKAAVEVDVADRVEWTTDILDADFGACMPGCNPLTQLRDDGTACPMGSGCYGLPTGPVCARAGTVAVGAEIVGTAFANSCVPGATGLRAPDGRQVCAAYCAPTATSSASPAGANGVSPEA